MITSFLPSVMCIRKLSGESTYTVTSCDPYHFKLKHSKYLSDLEVQHHSVVVVQLHAQKVLVVLKSEKNVWVHGTLARPSNNHCSINCHYLVCRRNQFLACLHL